LKVKYKIGSALLILEMQASSL